MGRGKKTQVFTRNERIPSYPTTVNSSVSARNLRKGDLAGVIFGCKHQTIAECLSKQLFGLPAPHFSYIKNVEPGLPLFLFNYSDRKLHGIFESASGGKMNIDPYAWTENGSETTPYPSQVRMCTRTRCQPLQEMQFRPIICDNFYTSSHFWFELDHTQVERLIVLFTATCNSGARINPPTNLANRQQSIGNANSTSVPSTRTNLFAGSKKGPKPLAKREQANQFEALAWEDAAANNECGSCSVSSSIGYDGKFNLSEFPDINPTSKNIGCSSTNPCFEGDSLALEAHKEIRENDEDETVGMQLAQALQSFQMK
ncbi:hypothetical protein MRB53_006005 [Persea americana]|uniref:Uncharacterized protein n=1 Tax=Persea americana TaxID=3435 RepID=A0ACC2MEX6_PERAE|nr:hypothetical protein MRB53_006005 [Persea americana]